MFKNIIQQSKKLVYLVSIIPALMFSNTHNAAEKTLKQIEENKKTLIKNNILIDLVKNINNTTKDTKFRLNNLNDEISNFYLPKNIDFEWIDRIKLQLNNFPNSFIDGDINNVILKKEDYYKAISQIDKNKKVFINESFLNYIDFDKEKKLSLNDLKIFKYKVKEYDSYSLTTISFLNNNPNITLVKAAGNNFDINNERSNDKLKLLFDKLSNHNYELTKELIPFLNLIIQKQIEENQLNNNLKDFLMDFQELCRIKNVNYDDFISLYIKDYLIHYENLALLKNNKELKYNNLKIVESINYDNIILKYNDYKEYLILYKKESKLIEIEKEFKELKIKGNKLYDSNDVIKLKELITKYEKKYPEIFKYTVQGTFSNFQYHNLEIIKRAVEGQDSYYEKDAFTGTSAACPEYLSDLVIETINNDQELNINHLGDNK